MNAEHRTADAGGAGDHASVKPRATGTAASPAARAANRLDRASMETLQRTVGNAAVVKLMRQSDVARGPLADAYNAARAAKDAYVKAGVRGPALYDPSKRNKKNYYGGFDVSYDPQKMVLSVELKGVADFQPGINLAGDRAVANEPSPETRTEVDKINKLPKAQRPAAVKKWQWSSTGGPDADDEQQFLKDYHKVIDGTWSRRFGFVCTKEWWEDLGATVEVNANVVKRDATHQPGAPYHMRMLVYKVPAGYVGGQADVHRTDAGNKSPYSNLMTVTAADVSPRGDHLLDSSFSFEAAKATLAAPAQKRLTAMAKNMPNVAAGATVATDTLTVNVQGADQAQRQARFTEISKALIAGGMDKSRIVLIEGGAGNKATITVGNGVPQVVAAHESGHMFGLDDEYTSSNAAYAAGKKTEHTDFAAAAGETGIVHADSDNIMSEGSVVRRQHYVTFLDALKVVSGMEDWTFGDPRTVQLPSPYEDAPTPEPFSPHTRHEQRSAVG